MAFFRKLVKFSSWPGRRKLRLIEAALLLVVSHVTVHWLPFSWYQKLLTPKRGDGASRPEGWGSASPSPEIGAVVHWSIGTASRHLPWESTCLVQATAARWMLSRRGLPSTLFLGTRKGEQGTPDFHAWLTCGDEVICGHHERERYTVLHSFGS